MYSVNNDTKDTKKLFLKLKIVWLDTLNKKNLKKYDFLLRDLIFLFSRYLFLSCFRVSCFSNNL